MIQTTRNIPSVYHAGAQRGLVRCAPAGCAPIVRAPVVRAPIVRAPVVRAPDLRLRRGISLVEVILALAIAAMISAGVASLLFAVANGTKDRQEVRRRNVKADVTGNRIDTAIRSSAMLLGRDSRALVLWTGDSRANEMPNLSELIRIEWDPATKEIRAYRAPADLAAAADIAYDRMTTDFLATTSSLAGSATFPRQTWGHGVTAWQSGPASADQQTRLLHYGMTLEFAGASPATIRSTVALRSQVGF